MDMRMQQLTLIPETACGLCRSQFTVEGEVTLPGSLRETTNVLYASAMVVVENAEAMQDRLSAAGRVVFCVIYTQGENHRVDSIEATADFSHLCEMPGAVPRAEVYAVAQAEHVDASVQNGRMSMRAIVRLCAKATRCEPVDVLTGIDIPGAQTRSAQMQLRRTVGRGSGETLLREEFDLPADLAIRDTLGAWAKATFFDTAGGQGRIGLSGEVTLEAIHASDLPGKPLVMTRHTVPVSQSVEISGENGDLLDGRITVKDVAVASQETGSGERTLRAEVLLGLSAWADRQEEVSVLTDAYTTSGDDLRLTATPLTVRTGDHRMHAAESAKATLLLPEGAAPVRTMLAAFVTPVMTDFTQQGSRLITEGMLETTLLYMSGASDAPMAVQAEAPFRAAFSAAASPDDIVLLTAANVEAVPITSDRVELRYVLNAQVEGMEAAEAEVVTDAAPMPAAPVTRDIVLYFTQPGETTWDIARRYRIPESELRRLNPGLNGDPKTGQGVVIWRRQVG
ncbi:MAG: SPOCS domain-containing protein [Aristaeellaceae bacterium]